jgi:uncharacterized protein DUF4129
VAALLFLAWSLGTLARSGPSSGGLLVNSYWLLYVVYLLPLLGLVGMVVMVVILALEWRVISDAIGMGLAARRGQKGKKRRNRLSLIIAGAAWAIALMVVYYRCPGFHCQATNTQNINQIVEQDVFNNTAPPQYLPLSGSIANLTGFFSTDWYIFPFMALIIIGGIIFARGVWVSAGETRRVALLTPRVQEEGQVAVREAMRVLAAKEEADPGSRIIACYQRMVRAAASLGADIGPDLTARELETGIRSMFHLSGPGIGQLTRLFEEARYSLHQMTEADSQEAQSCLVEIAEELKASPLVDEPGPEAVKGGA